MEFSRIQIHLGYPLERIGFVAIMKFATNDFAFEKCYITLVDVAVWICANALRVGIKTDQPNDSRFKTCFFTVFANAALLRRFANVLPTTWNAPPRTLLAPHDENTISFIEYNRSHARFKRHIRCGGIGIIVIEMFKWQKLYRAPSRQNGSFASYTMIQRFVLQYLLILHLNRNLSPTDPRRR